MQKKQMALKLILFWSLQNMPGREISLIFSVEEAAVPKQAENRMWCFSSP